MLARLESHVELWSRRMGLIGVVGFVAVAMITIGDVLLRWLFNSPVDGVEEVSQLMVAVAIASFFPLAIAERHHIAITFLGSALGHRSTTRLRALASIVTSLFFLLVGIQFIFYTRQVADAGETTWLLGWSVVPWWTATTVIVLTCIPAQLIVLAVDFSRALGGDAGADAVAAEREH